MKLRIVVADDNPGFLDVMVSILRMEFDVVATAADGKSALECVCQHWPDVAVLDLTMPLLNGLDVTKEVTRRNAGPAVVICSVETNLEIVEAARVAGALGYVFKKRVTKDLTVAVRSVVGGKSFVSPG
jgi:two-component system nitrate/nitrite response regulator NarL